MFQICTFLNVFQKHLLALLCSPNKPEMAMTISQMVDSGKALVTESRRELSDLATMAESPRDGAASGRKASLSVTTFSVATA